MTRVVIGLSCCHSRGWAKTHLSSATYSLTLSGRQTNPPFGIHFVATLRPSFPPTSWGATVSIDRTKELTTHAHTPTQTTLDDSFDASPALVNDDIYLRGYQYLYAISEQ